MEAVRGTAWCSPKACNVTWVRGNQIEDGICDLGCNLEGCGFDSGEGSFGENSDCYTECLAGKCDRNKVGNGECDLECDSNVCGWDGGDCGYCADGCKGYIQASGKVWGTECASKSATGLSARGMGETAYFLL